MYSDSRYIGCCHGMEYTGVLNVRYEAGSACELATGVFPVQIIETIIFISIYFVINKIKKNIVTITLLLSVSAKFILDFLRYSHIGKILSFNQIVCLIIAVVCILNSLAKNRRFRKLNMKSL